ncbi:hypothetical protein ACFY4C_37845 [Actinomadura viridis]|uniref:Rv1733c family protein n=1 Tax=Actinomadura viridis TaxID=58110 RepID=UPI0036BAEF78
MRGHGLSLMGARMDRLRRRFGFDRNSLRRDVDRAQRTVGVSAAVLFLGITPFAATRAAEASYESGLHAEHREAATRHQVTATVLGVGSSRPGGSNAAQVTWTDPDGSHHDADIPNWQGRPIVGQTQRIWVDDAGRPTVRPRMRSQTVGDASLAAVGATVATGTPLLFVYVLARRRYDRRRYDAWDTEWARYDSQRAR